MIDENYIIRKNETFVQALGTLKEAIEDRALESNNLIRDGAIKRFEYCFELAWKTVKLAIEFEDSQISGSPRQVLKRGIVLGILEDEEDWFRMLLERNNTVHLYNQSVASEIASHLEVNYNLMIRLSDRIKKRYK